MAARISAQERFIGSRSTRSDIKITASLSALTIKYALSTVVSQHKA
jgi:hypothetical protein